MVLWGIERFLDEHLWLGEDGHLGSLLVQIAGVALAVTGLILLATRIGPLRRWRNGEGGDPAPQLTATGPAVAEVDGAAVDGDGPSSADPEVDPEVDPAEIPTVSSAPGRSGNEG
jgi:hypothetical protein